MCNSLASASWIMEVFLFFQRMYPRISNMEEPLADVTIPHEAMVCCLPVENIFWSVLSCTSTNGQSLFLLHYWKSLGPKTTRSTSLLCFSFPLRVNEHACKNVTEQGDICICGCLYACMHVCGGQRGISDIRKLPVSAFQSWDCQWVPPLLPFLSFFLKLKFLSPCLPRKPSSCRSIPSPPSPKPLLNISASAIWLSHASPVTCLLPSGNQKSIWILESLWLGQRKMGLVSLWIKWAGRKVVFSSSFPSLNYITELWKTELFPKHSHKIWTLFFS